MDKKFLNVPFELKKEDIDETTGAFKGYGSTFGNKDSGGDVIMPGAFKKSIEAGGRNGNGIAMLLQHDSRKPIGVWTSLVENSKGLKVEGLLAMKTQNGKETYELMKMGALKGLSIGYRAIVHEYDSDKKTRFLREIELWEISPVTFGMNIRAGVTTVKDFKELIQQAKTERELEKALRESDIFSKAEAQHVISLLKTVLRDSGTVDEAGMSGILDTLKKINSNIDPAGGGMSGILDSLKHANI